VRKSFAFRERLILAAMPRQRGRAHAEFVRLSGPRTTCGSFSAHIEGRKPKPIFPANLFPILEIQKHSSFLFKRC
jgi:hypothetical protein